MTRVNWGSELLSSDAVRLYEVPREEEEGDDESMSPVDWDNASECPWGPDNDFDHYYDRRR